MEDSRKNDCDLSIDDSLVYRANTVGNGLTASPQGLRLFPLTADAYAPNIKDFATTHRSARHKDWLAPLKLWRPKLPKDLPHLPELCHHSQGDDWLQLHTDWMAFAVRLWRCHMNAPLQTESIDWSSVVVIGEYTSSIGPFGDDQFLVIVLRSGEWAAYPSAGPEAAEAIPLLESATGAKVGFGLSKVTAEASRVIFPPALAEHPLLVFGQPGKGFHALLKRIQRMGVVETSMKLTEEVQNYIRSIDESEGDSSQATPPLTRE